MTSSSTEQDDVLGRHREMLVVAFLAIFLAFLFQVRADDRVFVTGFPDYPLPHTCPSYAIFGVKCPGCGLTRGFVHLAHGRWQDAWKIHRFAWLMAAAVLFQLPYRLVGLYGQKRLPLGVKIPRLFGYLLVAALIGNWVYEVLGPGLTTR